MQLRKSTLLMLEADGFLNSGVSIAKAVAERAAFHPAEAGVVAAIGTPV